MTRTYRIIEEEVERDWDYYDLNGVIREIVWAVETFADGRRCYNGGCFHCPARAWEFGEQFLANDEEIVL